MVIHVVKQGESIYSISRLYKVPYEKILAENEIKENEQLVIGQTIVILEGTRIHKVVAGESLYSISREYRVPVADIIAANPQIINFTQITPGINIIIPSTTRKLGNIEVNGYALPNIDLDILRKTLPHLTYLSIFSYEVNPDGSLRSIEDSEIIQAARVAKVAPMMVITNLEKEGGFSSALARKIFTNNEVQDKLIANILNTLKTKNYYGLDIDFEYIYPEDREKYNTFLRKITSILNAQGYTVTTALAPKTSLAQTGLLYTAHDYPVHGALVDHVILMTYEWGYLYGPPLAVAPINEIRKVLDYAVTAIPREKIFIGIPNYGYDWTLPFVEGTAAKTLSITETVDLARKVGATILYDIKSQAPYFNYYDQNKKQHVVWFEDARSIEAKLKLVNYYKIGGVSYWTINRYFPQNWLVLEGLYNIKKLL